jgi:hypothetical protein
MDRISPQKNLQHHSTKFSAASQLELLPGRDAPVSAPVDKAHLVTIPTVRRVIRYAMGLADLDPKEVYDPLEYDKATWSKIENGSVEFAASKVKRFSAAVGNNALLMWLANEGGFDLRPQKSELQEQLDAERAENAKLRQEIATVMNFVRETQRK